METTMVINNSFPERATNLVFSVNELGVPDEFDVYKKVGENSVDGKFIDTLVFHEGSIENYNGDFLEEDLILMVLTRLNYLQQTKDACTENAESILYLEKVLQAMSKRKEDNEKRNNGVYTL